MIAATPAATKAGSKTVHAKLWWPAPRICLRYISGHVNSRSDLFEIIRSGPLT
jgi:hypothetical protein